MGGDNGCFLGLLTFSFCLGLFFLFVSPFFSFSFSFLLFFFFFLVVEGEREGNSVN